MSASVVPRTFSSPASDYGSGFSNDAGWDNRGGEYVRQIGGSSYPHNGDFTAHPDLIPFKKRTVNTDKTIRNLGLGR